MKCKAQCTCSCFKFLKSIVQCTPDIINPTLVPMGESNMPQNNFEYGFVIRLWIFENVLFAITHHNVLYQSLEMQGVFTKVLLVKSNSIQRGSKWFPTRGYTIQRFKLADLNKSFPNNGFIWILKGVPTRLVSSFHNDEAEPRDINESSLRILQIQLPCSRSSESSDHLASLKISETLAQFFDWLLG